MDYSRNYLNAFVKGLQSPICEVNRKGTSESEFLSGLLRITEKTRNEKGRIFFFGNGASASFANHMALDWSKNGGVLAFSLSDSALLTALANDYSYDVAAVEFLKINNINNKDLVITISSSGNSKNIVNVLEYCYINKIKTLAFSGLKNDNLSIKKSNFSVYVPAYTYGIVECCHQVILHLVLDKFMNVKEWDRNTFQNMSSNNFKI